MSLRVFAQETRRNELGLPRVNWSQRQRTRAVLSEYSGAPNLKGGGVAKRRSGVRGPVFAAIGVLVVAAVATVLAGLRLVRKVVTPPSGEQYEPIVLARNIERETITLRRTPDTLMKGSYSLLAPSGQSVVLEDVVDVTETTVKRRCAEVAKWPSTERRARFTGWLYSHPNELDGVEDAHEVVLSGATAAARVWIVRGVENAPGADTWVVHVHGRSAWRAETLRGVDVVRSSASFAGATHAVVAYRNDDELAGVAVAEPYRSRYTLGRDEWADVELALDYAVARGAQRIILYGWSMGALICARVNELSKHREMITGMILDSPVVSWQPVLALHARLAKAPDALSWVAALLLKLGFTRGGGRPGIDLQNMTLRTSLQMHPVRTLVLYSESDGFVPARPITEVVNDLGELVSAVELSPARHVKLYNFAPERYLGAVTAWLSSL